MQTSIKGFGDFESCSYQTARKLILQEFVALVGEHEMGLEYRLKIDKNIEVEANADDEDDDNDDVGLDAGGELEESENVIDDDDLEDAAASDKEEEEHNYDDDDGFGEEKE